MVVYFFPLLIPLSVNSRSCIFSLLNDYLNIIKKCFLFQHKNIFINKYLFKGIKCHTVPDSVPDSINWTIATLFIALNTHNVI